MKISGNILTYFATKWEFFRRDSRVRWDKTLKNWQIPGQSARKSVI